jgi:hypothetical protein
LLNATGGNVGIGTSSPAEKLSVAGAIITTGGITGHGASRATFSQEGANGAFLQSYGANTSTVGAFTLRQASSDFSVSQIPLSISTSGVLEILSGIKFPATQVASADVKTLDDYEEGTFTPSIAFGGASVGITYFDRQGNYTKIGRQVTCVMYIALTAVGSSTGNAQITGLPFTCANLNRGTVGAPSFRFSNITFSGQLTGSVPNNGTNIDLSNTSLLGTQTLLTNANFNSASEFNAITVTYFTA